MFQQHKAGSSRDAPVPPWRKQIAQGWGSAKSRKPIRRSDAEQIRREEKKKPIVKIRTVTRELNDAKELVELRERGRNLVLAQYARDPVASLERELNMHKQRLVDEQEEEAPEAEAEPSETAA